MNKYRRYGIRYSGIIAIKRDGIGSFVEMWMDLESVVQSEKEREKQLSYVNAYM